MVAAVVEVLGSRELTVEQKGRGSGISGVRASEHGITGYGLGRGATSVFGQPPKVYSKIVNGLYIEGARHMDASEACLCVCVCFASECSRREATTAVQCQRD